MEKKYEPLKILFGVLFFGGLWGIIEATLGSFLHLPMVKAAGIFVSNSAILVPLSMFLMGACYKRVGNARSILYMGVLAGSIKAIVCAIFLFDITPVFHILLEALSMAGALALIRPEKILSFKGLGTFILANTVYLTVSMIVRFKGGSIATPESVMSYIQKYVLMINGLAILYTFAVGAILYGIVKLAEVKEWKLEGLKKIVYSPITASIVAATMVVVTFLVR